MESLFNINTYENQSIQLVGWVHGKRGSNHVLFIQFRNSGKIIQVVAEKDKFSSDEFLFLKNISQETSLMIQGIVVKREQSSIGYEIILEKFIMIGSSNNYPITPKEHGTDFLHNHRHLWLRSKRQLSILRIRDELSFQIRKFFHEERYILIDTPILTGSIGESAGTLFETEYFDEGKAYLAQTGQLYLEPAIFAHNAVYCFGPTFRAEKSKTRRHLTEFWMVEAETAFFQNKESIDFQEKFIKYIVNKTIQNCNEDLSILEKDIHTLENYLNKPFPRVDYGDAIGILKKAGESIEWGEDINAERENILTKHFGLPIFIMNYPKSIKAFYMKENPENPQTVLCADLILPDGVGEVIGGSEREDNLQKLQSKIEEEGLDPIQYDWYLDTRKYGSVPHSGFGMGLERCVSWITGLPHVRECIPYPRTMGRIYP
jgi:asparaginyl-tRNA synthetase